MPVPSLAGPCERDDDDVPDPDADLLVATRARVGLRGGDRLDVPHLGCGTGQRIDGEAPLGSETCRVRPVRRRRCDTTPLALAAWAGVTTGHGSSIPHARIPVGSQRARRGYGGIAAIAVSCDHRSPITEDDRSVLPSLGGPRCWRAFMQRH
jgi:hypothetical protein